jgi:hypothetical protein
MFSWVEKILRQWLRTDIPEVEDGVGEIEMRVFAEEEERFEIMRTRTLAELEVIEATFLERL